MNRCLFQPIQLTTLSREEELSPFVGDTVILSGEEYAELKRRAEKYPQVKREAEEYVALKANQCNICNCSSSSPKGNEQLLKIKLTGDDLKQIDDEKIEELSFEQIVLLAKRLLHKCKELLDLLYPLDCNFRNILKA